MLVFGHPLCEEFLFYIKPEFPSVKLALLPLILSLCISEEEFGSLLSGTPVKLLQTVTGSSLTHLLRPEQAHFLQPLPYVASSSSHPCWWPPPDLFDTSHTGMPS